MLIYHTFKEIKWNKNKIIIYINIYKRQEGTDLKKKFN